MILILATFKEAARLVLSEAKKPLGCEEITRKALEKGLIKTTGKTPGNTMYTELYRDVKRKKNASQFLKLEAGKYMLNPKVSQ